MEKKTIGAFLSALRKANGMTQQEVADKLNVSNKTVSKWERDEGCPEIMMLPALAELYSVTVDEILRGERITKAEPEEQKNAKSEERIKYLTEKAAVKFTNCSIVSVVLGAVAFLLSYTVSGVVSYNYLWIAYVIILVLVASSLTVTLVAFNSFSAGLKNAAEIQNGDSEAIIRKCIKYITAVTFLAVVSLLRLIICIVVEVPDFIFVLLPVTVTVSAVAAYYVRSLLYKKYKIEQELSLAQWRYRRKHIKVTAIILIVVVISSFLLPFACGIIESSVHRIYSFPEGVGYKYETEEEAEREYYKLKAYVTGERMLYKINEYYSEETGVYILDAEPLQESFEQKNGRYNKTATELTDIAVLRFKSAKEFDKFKKENVLDDSALYTAEQRNLTFDDATLSVSYQRENKNFFRSVLDILPVFLLIGLGCITVVLDVSAIVYFNNKKKIV